MRHENNKFYVPVAISTICGRMGKKYPSKFVTLIRFEIEHTVQHFRRKSLVSACMFLSNVKLPKLQYVFVHACIVRFIMNHEKMSPMQYLIRHAAIM